MGGSLSSLSKPSSLSGKEFNEHAERRELQKMANALFQFMYKKWRPDDVFDMVEKPGEYVIAISDLINQQFHVLGYTTKSKKIGEIYFRKWKDVDPPKSSTELSAMNSSNNTRRKRFNDSYRSIGYNNASISDFRSKGSPGYKIHENHSKIIGFYFVRLFQILGSLLLVIKDTEINDTNSMTAQPNSLRRYAQQLSYPKFKQSGGGIQDEPLGSYEFLRRYLRDVNRAEYDAIHINLPQDTNDTKLYKVRDSDSLFFLYTKPKNVDEGTRTDLIDTKQSFIIVSKNTEEEKVYGYKTVNVSLSNINFFGDVKGLKIPSKITDKKEQYARYPRTVDLNVEGVQDKSRFHLKFNSNDMYDEKLDYSVGISYKIADDTDISKFILSSGARDMYKILERYIVSAYNMKNRGASIIAYKKKETKNTSGSAGASRTGEVVKNDAPPVKILEESFNMLLTKEKPHCIKRALDLLDASSILNLDTKDGSTKICQATMNTNTIKHITQLYGKLDVNKAISVNENEFKGAMAFLDSFVKKDVTNSLSVDDLNTGGQESESKGLSQALERLSKSFNKNKDAIVTKVSDIKIEAPSACSTRTSSKIVRGGPLFSTMQGYANQLLAFHLNNVIDISKFLKKIFNVSQRPDGSWEVKGPKNEIMFAGFDTLNELTDQARGLLLNYYTGCEDIYQKGVTAWDESDKPVAAVNAPGRVVSAPPLASGPPGAAPPAAPPATRPAAPPAAMGQAQGQGQAQAQGQAQQGQQVIPMMPAVQGQI